MIFAALFYLWWLSRQPISSERGAQSLQNRLEPEFTRITSAEFAASTCKVRILTTAEAVEITTGFEPTVSRCDQYSLVLPSPSGQLVAFEDLADGIDSQLRVYSTRHQQTINLENLAGESILAMAFLPDNRLAVLYGRGLVGQQQLKVYNLPKLVADFPRNSDDKLSINAEAIGENSSNLTLPNVGENYHYLKVDDGQLQVLGSAGVDSRVLAEFELSEIQ